VTLATGQMLQNRYRIVSPLGEGGMGAVYRAWDTRLSVPVALKEMTPQPGLDSHTLAQLRQQFQQEATVLARLDHPHLVDVTDFFEEGGNAYLVMKFIEGESLADRIEREGSLPEAQVLAWADQLLDALAYCHTQGIIHRDVSPQNVIVRPDGRAALVDFGLVKLWDPGDPRTKTVMRGMGKPEYTPPEQYDAQLGHTDTRSDIYSLGATLYHTLTGQAPPTATQRIASRGAFQPPRALNKRISSATEAAVLRAMELTVEDRFSTAQEMVAALRGEAVAPTRPAPPRRKRTKMMPGARPALPRWKRVPVWAWVLGGLAALVVGIVMGVGSAGRPVARATPTAVVVVAQATSALRPTSTPAATYPTDSVLGAHLAFVSDRDGKREIYRLTKAGEVVRVTNTPGDGESWSPALVPDGTVLFTSDRDGKREVYRLTKAGEVVQVTNTPGDGESWSPIVMLDGTVLFTSDRDGKQEIYRLTKAGEVVQVTNTPGDGESWSPVLVPDGTVLFTSDRDGKREIYRLTKAGEVVQVTNTPNNGESWSPAW